MASIESRLALSKMLVTISRVGASEQLDIVLAKLDKLQEQPALGYPYSQAAVCYALMNERAKCLETCLKGEGFATPMAHYAPPARADRCIAALSCRFFLFMESIETLKTEGGKQSLSAEARSWIDAFPNVRYRQAILLLGLFLGFRGEIPALRRVLLISNPNPPHDGLSVEEIWLSIPGLDIALDPLIVDRETGEIGGIFPEEHRICLDLPGMAKSEDFCSQIKALPPECGSLAEEGLDAESRKVMEELLSALCSISKGAWPSAALVQQTVQEGVLAVPVPE